MPDTTLLPSVTAPESKLDNVLQFCIDNRDKYLPESVEGALAELQKRGVVFSAEELQVIQEDMQARREIAAASNSNWALYSATYKDCLVHDPAAYAFYSRRAVRLFSFFFGAFFGSILMAININKTKNQQGVMVVLLYGVAFTIVQIVISAYASLGSSISIFFGFAAAYSIDYFFWDKYIGNATLYRAKPYWVPLVIALAITIPLVAAAIYGNVTAEGVK